MLLSLHIQNYAIIDTLELNLSGGLNIITGETGAGKSIIMGALGLILGERADSSALRDKERKCVIEGCFVIDDKKEVIAFLSGNDMYDDDNLILRREISPSGKSRGFINDTPATLQQLKQLASLLVDLHRQFDTLELGDSSFQREVTDALAGNDALLQRYRAVYIEWVTVQQQLRQLQEQKNNFDKELGYHQFLFDELSDAAFRENELEEAEAELKVLSNSEAIKAALGRAVYDMKESEQPVLQVLKQMIQQLKTYSEFHFQLAAIIERLQSTQIELHDINSEIEHLDSTIRYDAQRIDYLNERMATGYKLLKKHGVQTTQELAAIQQQLETRLQEVLHIDDAIAAKEKQAQQLLDEAVAIAGKISQKRKQVIPGFTKQVNALLVRVGMPNASVKVSIEDVPLHEYGSDRIELLFDGNKTNRYEPLRKVASGGELSRLMLCIKSLVAESIDLPTLIFDEIDSGISGEAAKQVGLIMQQLAQQRQIICITHQPQIAGKATTHFFIFKEIVGDTIQTKIRVLNNDERIQAIAKMLSGEKPTAAALENAREMMRN